MSSSDSLSTVDSITFAIPSAILVFFIVFLIFQWEYQWPFFRMVLYLGIPALVYLVTSIASLLAQYSGCGAVRAGDVFLYSLPNGICSLVAVFLSSFSWCRIPIASVVAPLFLRGQGSNSTSKEECCGPRMTLETVELQAPMVKGFAYGFYLFFATIFGLLVSVGFASLC